MLKIFNDKTAIVICFGLVFIGSSAAAYITPEVLKQNKPKIRTYIIEYTAGRIAQSQGRFVTKALACTFGKISSEVYDSMPLYYFQHKQEIEKIIDTEIENPEAADYICQSVLDFKKTQQPVNDDTLGKFFFSRTVERLNLDEECKKTLRMQPIKMEEYVKIGIIPKSDYMNSHTYHLIAKYFLEIELK